MTLSELGLNNVTAAQASDPSAGLPEGEYLVRIGEAGIVQSEKKAGVYNVKTILNVLEGEYKGRTEYWYVCIKHDQPDVERIGQETLRELYFACGYGEGFLMNDVTHELTGKTFIFSKYASKKTGEIKVGHPKRATAQQLSTPGAAGISIPAAPASIPQPQSTPFAQAGKPTISFGAGFPRS